MAIHYDFTTCATQDQNLREAGMWATFAVGINHITEKNADEFFKRTKMVERVSGAYRMKCGEGNKIEGVFMTREEVSDLIGLRTNASSKTKTQFLAHLYKLADIM